VVPMRIDYDPETVESCLTEIEAAGLAETYSVEGETYLRYTKFDRHQSGLRREKAVCPKPLTKCLGDLSGNPQAIVKHVRPSEVKGSEGKGREVKGRESKKRLGKAPLLDVPKPRDARARVPSGGKSGVSTKLPLGEIQEKDLKNAERVEGFYQRAIELDWLSKSEPNQLLVHATAENILRLECANPGALFTYRLNHRAVALRRITNADEDRAREKIRILKEKKG